METHLFPLSFLSLPYQSVILRGVILSILFFNLYGSLLTIDMGMWFYSLQCVSSACVSKIEQERYCKWDCRRTSSIIYLYTALLDGEKKKEHRFV